MNTNLLFGIHCHQPYNNFYEVIHEATDKSYYPFLKILANFPKIKLSIHYSGWLFNWIKENRAEVFNLIKKLAERNQIEIFTSGFYEPILASIPEKDAELQIKKSNKFIKDNFGIEPEGLWLTERVWDDKIIKVLVNCGIKYVVVDDYHLISAGHNKNNLQGYFLTEDEGYSIAIFPISKQLRYLIPFNSVENCVKVIKSLQTGIIFDDGEKFGLWPHTYEWVYEKNWLKSFFEYLSHDNNIFTLTFKEFFYSNKPIGRVYLPVVSYFEMGEWSLSYESGKEFLNYLKKFQNEYNISNDIIEKFFKGGIWKNFLVKYEESNNIHKKMLKLSKKLKNKKIGDELTEWLLKSQCNDCLWHGIFGGIYLPNLRNNSYIALNNLEKLLPSQNKETFNDYNNDGYGELQLKNSQILAVISEKHGAQLFELSDLETGFNIGNTLTRRKEIYHDEILKSNPLNDNKINNEKISTIHEMKYIITKEIKDNLIFDNYLKYSFVDLIFDKYQSFEHYKLSKLENLGNFNESFNFNISTKSFIKNGIINILNKNLSVSLEKKYNLKKNKLSCEYSIKNFSPVYFDLYHGIELNFFFPGENSKDSKIYIDSNEFKILSEIKIDNPIKNFKIFDSILGKFLEIESNLMFMLWSYPFYSISKSEKAYEKTYQGSSFLLIFPFRIKLGEIIKKKITITVG